MPLILVSSQVKNSDQYLDDVVGDLTPRVDYMEICQRIGGKISGYGLIGTYWYALGRRLEKIMKIDVFESIKITRQISQYNVILSTSEKTAIPLSMLLALNGKSASHVVIAHHLSSKNKRRLFRMWPLYNAFNHVICVSKAQADYAVDTLNIPASRVHFIYDKVDHIFFRPMGDEPEDFIIAVGQEQRDYKTLQKALAGTGIRLILVASSHWSTYRLPIIGENNTQVVRNIPYTLLRSLYSRARLVVVPLNNVNYAAGANAILEALAMGKPTILSKTPGIQEYIEDGETGLFVEPGNPQLLREKILSIWNDPNTQKRLGENGRQVVEENMKLPIYVNKITNILEKVIEENQ